MSASDMNTQEGLSEVLRKNIREMAALKSHFERQAPPLTRLADRVTRSISNPFFLVGHLVLVAAWLAINVGAIPGIRPFDPFPFVMLAMAASVEAIFLTSFVLISQDRLSQLSLKRDNLDLQISLLTEHELTRLIALVEGLMRHMHAPLPSSTHELEQLKADVEPTAVVREIDREEQRERREPQSR